MPWNDSQPRGRRSFLYYDQYGCGDVVGVGGLIKSVITDQAFNVRICRHVTLIVFTLERDIVSGNTTIKQEIYGNRNTRQTPKMVAIML